MNQSARKLEELYAAQVAAVQRELRGELPEWSNEEIRAIVQDCIDNDKAECERWHRYAKDRQLTIALNGDGAWIRLQDYQQLESEWLKERRYANTVGWWLLGLGVTVIGLVVFGVKG